MVAPPELLDLAKRIAVQEGIPAPLFAGHIQAESAWNVKAYRAEPQIKDASYGLVQILYGTARNLGYRGTPEGLFDPETNLRLGAQFIKQNLARFGGQWEPAVAAYNAGPGRVAGDIKKAGSWTEGFGLLPAITRSYVPKVLNWAAFYAGKIGRAQAEIASAANAVHETVGTWVKAAETGSAGWLFFAVAGVVGLGALLWVRR